MVQQIETDIFYPESDGQPMGETDLHRRLLAELVIALTNLFEGRPNVYVTGNIFIYYVEGQPQYVVCPDVCVVFGVAQADREIYQTWRDGRFPQVVIELTSPSTRREDLRSKPALYERLGVLEYYIFDPHPNRRVPIEQDTGELRCYRRLSVEEPFGLVERVAADALVHSQELGLGLVVHGRELRLVDEATGALLPTSKEEVVARRAAEAARAAAEAAQRDAEARAQALADEVARLRAELDKRSES
jgi:Uma2 family endonuclease